MEGWSQAQTHTCMCREKYGGHGRFMQSSTCRGSIQFFGRATAGSIEIDTEFLATIRCRNKGSTPKDVREQLGRHRGFTMLACLS
jgi:hypothetical protein